jgi:CTP-dependent riboflavin kinase
MVYKLKGIVSKGCGDSSNWMPDCLPDLYPGTLNLQIDCPLPKIKWQTITYHKKYKKNFYRHPCTINGIDAFIIVPPLCTSDATINGVRENAPLEIAHKEKLRDLLSLKNGDAVTIRINKNDIS